jgi:hypothetical protein
VSYEVFDRENMQMVFDLWQVTEPLPEQGKKVVIAFPGGAVWTVTAWGDDHFKVVSSHPNHLANILEP